MKPQIERVDPQYNPGPAMSFKSVDICCDQKEDIIVVSTK